MYGCTWKGLSKTWYSLNQIKWNSFVLYLFGLIKEKWKTIQSEQGKHADKQDISVDDDNIVIIEAFI